MSYIWKLPQKPSKEFIDKFPELHPIVVQLLYNRNLKTQKEIDEFLSPDYSKDVHDPHLFKDMEKACQRIYKAIKNKELITVYGDYDADGVSSAVILRSVLKNLKANVEVYLPHRAKEGYGLNKKAVEELAKKSKVVITCDCGISNYEEVDIANEKGLDVIITDHHTVPEKLPKALAIIHPQVDEKYPFKFLAGGGVAFKLAQALLSHAKNDLSAKEKEINEKWLLDMVALATVADMVPLLGENRTLVKYGMLVLKKTQRLGMKKLIEIANLDVSKIDTRSIGFSLAPRINAAGRMDHANLAYYLMIEEDEDKAIQLAKDLNQSNLDRQKLTERIVREAKAQKINEDDSLLTFYNPDWSSGLTGLVAGRLAREHSRPVFVMTKVDENIVGSGRSVPEFNIIEALQDNEELLIKYGGHPQACGFSMDPAKQEEFIKVMKENAANKLKDVQFISKLEVELGIDFEDISWDLVDLLEKFRPYGQKNPEPLFMSTGLSVTSLRQVGNDGKHLKLEVSKGNKKKGAIAFGMGKMSLELGDKIDIVYNLSINQWNGNREIQLIIKDIKNNG
ncbi:MAG: single-stranded-DNA-specific exonuclease RecJ [Candidatus Komeilibacteria bacterium]|nr:single-stranded-DNA-specific exonuclease RecJ [Candidatus Komeilibacteria bacterium]